MKCSNCKADAKCSDCGNDLAGMLNLDGECAWCLKDEALEALKAYEAALQQASDDGNEVSLASGLAFCEAHQLARAAITKAEKECEDTNPEAKPDLHEAALAVLRAWDSIPFQDKTSIPHVDQLAQAMIDTRTAIAKTTPGELMKC